MGTASDTGRQRPLVIDLTTAWSGPLCTAVLADFGWDVVKIETAGRPDVTRRLGPWADEIPGVERSGYFETLNRGKRSAAINLSTAEGKSPARELCERADVVVENFSPGVMERLGLGYESLRSKNPGLVMVSISGYGQAGPERSYVAYGQTIEALSGIDAATGYRGDEPRACGAPIADHVAGMSAALAVMAAVERKARTGEGCYIDLSMVEGMVAVAPEGVLEYQLAGTVPRPAGNADPAFAPHGCYPGSGEDCWIALTASTSEQWTALCGVIGRPDLGTDPRFNDAQSRLAHRDLLDREISSATRTFDLDELTASLRAAGVPATPVLNGYGLRADETLSRRSFFSTVEHPETGVRDIPGRQAVLSWLDPALSTRSPLLGEHTRDVFRSLLGMSDDEIEALREAGALT